MEVLDIAKQFSKFPGGRYRKHGKFSGEEFRDTLLVPSLRNAIARGTKLAVRIDGVRGFGSSFLEEAFGGLIRKSGMNEQDVLRHLEIQMSDVRFQIYKSLVDRYIHEAALSKAS